MEFKARLCLVFLLSFALVSSARIMFDSVPGIQGNRIVINDYPDAGPNPSHSPFVLSSLLPPPQFEPVEVSGIQGNRIVINDYPDAGPNPSHSPIIPSALLSPPQFEAFDALTKP
ncbi:uncharacterized protein LOC111492868 [Cucurbita maxima]|uniref:Uncharacterized protein LOC111492868 n=1 Tax=Cucurbita maxima TaxID=3661 RepID=A0A6J1K718_CUCMA|nr:uncharacterized protein LOC111492868 [Cucurbita maxima]